MSAASAMLEVGRLALVGHHGESLSWIPASAVLLAETGEAIPNEGGKAILLDDTATTFTGIFDDAYQVIDASTGAIASTGPAVLDVSPSDLPLAARGDVIIRDGTQYNVIDIRPDGLISLIFILSKHAN